MTSNRDCDTASAPAHVPTSCCCTLTRAPQETVHQAHNLAQSDEDEDFEEHDGHLSQTAAAETTSVGNSSSDAKAPRSSQRRPQSGRGKKGEAAAAGTAAEQHATEELQDAHGDASTATAAGGMQPRSSKRQRGKGRQGSRAPATWRPVVSEEGAAASSGNTDDAGGGAAEGQPGGAALQVGDALTAAKHAVQELWVPQRKPTPGKSGGRQAAGRTVVLVC